MSARVSDDWRAENEQSKRSRIFGPAAWYVGLAWSAASIAFWIAAWMIIVFRQAASDSWFFVAIFLAAVGFATAVPAAGTWIANRWATGEGSRRPASADHEKPAGDGWSSTLAPHTEPLELEHPPGRERDTTDMRARSARYHWVALGVLALVLLAIVLLFRFVLWQPLAAESIGLALL